MVTESFTTCRFLNCRTVPEPGYADRGLCAFHEQTGLDALEALPGDHATLRRLVGQKTRGRLGVVGAPFGPSEPIDLETDALADEILYTVTLWSEIVRDRARLSEQRDDVTSGCQILAAHYTVLVAVPPQDVTGYDRQVTSLDGPDAVVWLTHLHRRALARAGMTEREYAVDGTCPECLAQDLRHRDSRDTVWCGTCRSRWPWDDYMTWLEAQIFGAPA